MHDLIFTIARGLFALITISVILSLILVWLYEERSTKLPSDLSRHSIIVVFGARVTPSSPSPELASRLDYAIELHQMTHKPIAVSGGFSGATSEAKVMLCYLQGRGIETNQLKNLEPGNCTASTFKSMASLGTHYCWLAVSSPYHSARLHYFAMTRGINLTTCCPRLAKTGCTYLMRQRLRETLAILKLILEDTAKYIFSLASANSL